MGRPPAFRQLALPSFGAAGIMYMTMTKMCIWIKRNLAPIIAAMLAIVVLVFDAASVSAFERYGRPSGPRAAFNGGRPVSDRPAGPPSYRRGQGYYRPDPGPRNYRSNPGPGYYRNGRGPGFYRGEPFSPYGGPWRGGYGERSAVRSRGDAQRMLNDYYMGRNMRIGPVRENQFYFEADVLDRNNRFMDRVIIDKRSGRIRSIY